MHLDLILERKLGIGWLVAKRKWCILFKLEMVRNLLQFTGGDFTLFCVRVREGWRGMRPFEFQGPMSTKREKLEIDS
jgi:hypothetical protein